MKCPECGGKIRVTDTTNIVDTNEIYRKRECIECMHVFYTVEFEVDCDNRLKLTLHENSRFMAHYHANKEAKNKC